MVVEFASKINNVRDLYFILHDKDFNKYSKYHRKTDAGNKSRLRANIRKIRNI
jgi:hypothetical protein